MTKENIIQRVIAPAVLVAATALALLLPSTAGAMKPASAAGAKPGTQTIAEIAVGNPNFSTLVAALSCEGLVPAVSGMNQLTVFAPTDDAFDTLGLNAGNICDADLSQWGGLTNILTYHVTNGRRTSTSVLAAPGYTMLNGDRLTRAELSMAGISATDISARNGVIHVIDNVLLP